MPSRLVRLCSITILVAILLTGVPGLNFTGNTRADLLRLNTKIAPTGLSVPETASVFSREILRASRMAAGWRTTSSTSSYGPSARVTAHF